ncbi:peptidoglycan binding domain-containing protein [Nocardioides panacisoli]|uniref:YoaR-like putative peptidoglycan binding domain-containing protein n=1 Tax=Nocardioides panacisoli TaxID=627624 RepID=A0ABP7HW83_9ACTN
MTFWDDPGQGAEEPSPGKRERAGGWVVIAVVLFLVLVVGGAYATTAAVNGDKVPLGTTVSGVDIGGLSRADARSKLADFFDKRDRAQLRVSVSARLGEGRTVRTSLAKVGFSLDYDATLDDAGAVQAWTPARQWDYFTGGQDVAPVVEIDEHRLRAQLVRLAQGLRTPPRNGRVVITRHGVSSVDAESGQEIDIDAAGHTLSEAFASGDRSVQLAVVPARPDIDDADVQRALRTFANPAMSSAVTLRVGRYVVRLRPQQFGAALSMVPQEGVLQPHVDTTRLTMLVDTALSRVVPPTTSGPHRQGVPGPLPAYDPTELVTAFLRTLTQPEGHRDAGVDVQPGQQPSPTSTASPEGTPGTKGP